MDSGGRRRNVALDVAKLLLAIGVVGLHTEVLVDYSLIAGHFFVNGVARLAVPFFIIITGFFYIDRIRSGAVKDWVRRLLVLYVFWSLVYLPFWFDLGGIKGIAKTTYFAFFGYFHLWYLVGVLYAGIFVGLCWRLGRVFFIFSASALYFFGLILQYAAIYDIGGFAGRFPWVANHGMYRNFVFFVFPFFVFGCFLRSDKDLIERLLVRPWISAIIFFAFFSEVCANYVLMDGRWETFDMLATLPLASASLFFLVRRINLRINYNRAGLHASGIYFVHPLIMYVGTKFLGMVNTPLFLFTFSLSYLCAIVLYYLNLRIRFIL